MNRRELAYGVLATVITVWYSLLLFKCSLASKIRDYIEDEMSVPIIPDVVIRSPSVLLFVRYDEFIGLIHSLGAETVYRSYGDYYVFNQDMSIAYRYSLNTIDLLRFSRIMRENR